MCGKRSDQALAERAIVLQVLRDDHSERWTRAELERELSDFYREAVEVAIEGLGSQSVVDLDGEEVWASLGTRRLDKLGLITI